MSLSRKKLQNAAPLQVASTSSKAARVEKTLDSAHPEDLLLTIHRAIPDYLHGFRNGNGRRARSRLSSLPGRPRRRDARVYREVPMTRGFILALVSILAWASLVL